MIKSKFIRSQFHFLFLWCAFSDLCSLQSSNNLVACFNHLIFASVPGLFTSFAVCSFYSSAYIPICDTQKWPQLAHLSVEIETAGSSFPHSINNLSPAVESNSYAANLFPCVLLTTFSLPFNSHLFLSELNLKLRHTDSLE